jgi:type II secretory pathway pseudopilin PulG
MTRPTLAHSNRGARRLGSGFTLVELLVVIGIIVLLIGLLLPMGLRAFRQADRARVASELQAIGSALEAYKQDHGFYPDPGADPSVANGSMRGANTLCRALIAPGRAGLDGADGPGFQARPGGKVWPAYLSQGQFKVGNLNANATIDFTTIALSDYQQVFILDRFNKPVLYYRAQGNPNIRTSKGFVAANSAGVRALYDSSQNVTFLTEANLRAMLGDISGGGPVDANSPVAPDGMINGTETAAFSGPYILWSAGPNETYGPDPGDTGNTSAIERCDDVTNFRN